MATLVEQPILPSASAPPSDTPTLDRAPSRAGYRRPPLARSYSSRNLFPDLPPISTTPIVRYPFSSSDDSDSDDDGHGDGDKPLSLAVPLPPLCGPPSPISPVSPASSSSSGDLLPSPFSSNDDLTDYEDLPGCDGFPPPPLPHSTFVPPPPPQPATPLDFLDDHPPTLFHHGISRSAFSMHREFWDRRYHLWQSWRDQVDHLNSIQAAYARDGLRATLRYPPPPVLPRSRSVPGQRANGTVPRQSQSDNVPQSPSPDWHLPPRVRLQTYNPYAPIFPRLGDISALRDPYCDWYDRAYINFPTYSIHKILYLHDMLDRARHSTYPPPHLVQDAPLPHSPASTYSTDPLEPLLLGESHAGSPPESDARPWELHWSARWQVLVHRQPYAPHQLSSSSYDHSPPHDHSAPRPSPQAPVHTWSSPSPVSPVFGPAAHQPLSHAPAEADDNRRVYVWEESDAVPELVPLDSPLTRAELEFGAASVADVGVFPASGRSLDGDESALAYGSSVDLCVDFEATAPVVKLPTTTTSSSSGELCRESSSDGPPLSHPPAHPSSDACSPPRASSSFAAALAAAAAASAGSDTESESETEEDVAVRFRAGLFPARPASPAPTPIFFFFFEEGEEEEDVPGRPASMSVQPVSC